MAVVDLNASSENAGDALESGQSQMEAAGRGPVFFEIQRAGGVADGDAAPHLLDNITHLELEEIRQLKRPPATVRRVMECVHLVLGEGSVPGLSWDDVLRTVVNMDFLQRVRRFNLSQLLEKPALVDRICRTYFAGEESLEFARVRRGSKAVVAFFGWTVGLVAEALPHWPVEEVGGAEARDNIARMKAEMRLAAEKERKRREAAARRAARAAMRNEIGTQTTPRQECEDTQQAVVEVEGEEQDGEKDRDKASLPLEQVVELADEATEDSEPVSESDSDDSEDDEDSDEDEIKDFRIWDLARNPDRRFLRGEGAMVHFPSDDKVNFCNVMTAKPVRRGAHFFEFVMHRIGDEQWCGVTTDRVQAGVLVSGRKLDAWSYYCGRRQYDPPPPGGVAALHVKRQAVQEFAQVRSGDVIGMLLDAKKRAVAFLHNGKLQGVCKLPAMRQPLFLFTHLDAAGDAVELRNPPLSEAPTTAKDAIKALTAVPPPMKDLEVEL